MVSCKIHENTSGTVRIAASTAGLRLEELLMSSEAVVFSQNFTEMFCCQTSTTKNLDDGAVGLKADFVVQT